MRRNEAGFFRICTDDMLRVCCVDKNEGRVRFSLGDLG
jgi:hypothetical protein